MINLVDIDKTHYHIATMVIGEQSGESGVKSLDIKSSEKTTRLRAKRRLVSYLVPRKPRKELYVRMF